jgi:hypothetical protein
MKALQRALVVGLLGILYFLPAAAQNLRTELGEEKALAVEAMLKAVYPDATPVWGYDLFVQAADKTRTKLALTNVIKVVGLPQPEFVAGIQAYDRSSQDLVQLRKGEAISGARLNLVAVAKDAAGAFQLVSSMALEPSHALTTINQLNSDPTGSPRVLISYKTIDVYDAQVVEISWRGVLDASLDFLQKRPSGVEIESNGSNLPSRVLYITPSATGVLVTNYQTQTQTNISCPKICEPTVQQLAAIN